MLLTDMYCGCKLLNNAAAGQDRSCGRSAHSHHPTRDPLPLSLACPALSLIPLSYLSLCLQSPVLQPHTLPICVLLGYVPADVCPVPIPPVSCPLPPAPYSQSPVHGLSLPPLPTWLPPPPRLMMCALARCYPLCRQMLACQGSLVLARTSSATHPTSVVLAPSRSPMDIDLLQEYFRSSNTKGAEHSSIVL